MVVKCPEGEERNEISTFLRRRLAEGPHREEVLASGLSVLSFFLQPQVFTCSRSSALSILTADSNQHGVQCAGAALVSDDQTRQFTAKLLVTSCDEPLIGAIPPIVSRTPAGATASCLSLVFVYATISLKSLRLASKQQQW